jgi:hypothetical protein
MPRCFAAETLPAGLASAAEPNTTADISREICRRRWRSVRRGASLCEVWRAMADHPDAGKLVQVDGVPIGTLFATFESGDDLVTQLRKRMSYIGLSFNVVEELAGMSEGAAAKYLSSLQVKKLTVASMMRLCEPLGIKALLVVDPKLVAKMQPKWEMRDSRKVHSRRLPKIGEAQRRRILKPVAAELGRRGGRARQAKLSIEERRAIGRRGAAVRWRKAEAAQDQP